MDIEIMEFADGPSRSEIIRTKLVKQIFPVQKGGWAV